MLWLCGCLSCKETCDGGCLKWYYSFKAMYIFEVVSRVVFQLERVLQRLGDFIMLK